MTLPPPHRYGKMLGASLAAGIALGLTGCGDSTSSTSPESREGLQALRITEIHYHPADEGEIAGDEYEFLEIQNGGEEDLDLADIGFTDGIDFTFAKGARIEAKAYLVLASNATRFRERYGVDPDGVYTGKLSNSGETLILSDLATGDTLASVTYADAQPWPSLADGEGPSLALLLTPSGSVATQDGSPIWRLSFSKHGSPGKGEASAVLINEALTHTDLPDRDAVELYNPNPFDVDISGWYLSDDRDEPAKFKIPSGTTIGAESYLVYDEADFNNDSTSSTSFNMSAHGEEIYLFADAGGCDAGYCHGFEFGEIENGTTFGRYVNSEGRESFVAQTAKSLGKANAGPVVGPVVFTEIMYHPVDEASEYLELQNVSDHDVDLFDPDFPENTWKIKGVGFTFPDSVTLEPGEKVIILSDSVPESDFRIAQSIDSTARIFIMSARLSNSSESLTLMQPQEPYSTATQDSIVPYKVVEKVKYADNGPWPGNADGIGQSLERKDNLAFGDDPENWRSENPSPGR